MAALQRTWIVLLAPIFAKFIHFLPGYFKIVLFDALCKEFSVQKVCVSGYNGKISGSPADLAMLGTYMMTNKYSEYALNVIMNYIDKKGIGTFIDIGANLGFFTIPILKRNVKCIAFEPDPVNFSFLKENIRDNFIDQEHNNIELYNLALYDSSEDQTFSICDWNYGDHRIYVKGNSISNKYLEHLNEIITIKANRLDDLISPSSINYPLVIKIDTQGSEVNVIGGGTDIISRADLLIIEFWPYGIKRQNRSEEGLINFIRRHFNYGQVRSNKDYKSRVIYKIEEIANLLINFSNSNPGTKYLDLFLFKQNPS
jgi:FkbM family methyltransferase